jgi:hypothetical protein
LSPGVPRPRWLAVTRLLHGCISPISP